MLRAEAIKILKAAETDHFPYEPEKLVEAFELAIASLETDEAYQLEYEKPTTKNDLGVDCISRDAVKYYIQAHIHEIITESGKDKNAHTNGILRALLNGVNTMPSVTPQEPKTGQWIIYNYPGHEHVYCSSCKEEYYEEDLYMGGSDFPKYCPNCGCAMVEPQESEGKE